MTIEYLTKEHLAGFDNYKYNAKDTSPLSLYVMHPFWNYIVKYFPEWLAPNVMTFVGFLLTALNFVMLSWYDWDFYASTSSESAAPVPNWFWGLAALNIFLAYTLDGIDGKQARRIGLAGPLGEMFDHGLDSYSAVLIPACLYSIFGREDGSVPPIRMYFVMWTITFNFFISHWEKYNTGVLYLPWGYDLGMWGSTLLYYVTWHYGQSIWKYQLPFGIETGNAMEMVLHASAMSNVPVCFYNIYKSYKDKTGKMRPPMEALRPFFPFAAFMLISFYWVYRSPNDIINKDPRALYLLTGTIFSNISCRLIVAQMSNTRCEGFNFLTLLLLGAMLVSFYMPILERFLVYLLLLLSTLLHWHYGTIVVQQMCTHFDRICFKVTKPRQRKVE